MNDKYKESFSKFKERLANGGELKKEEQPMSEEYRAYIEKLNTPTITSPTKEDVIKSIWYKLNLKANDGKFEPNDIQRALMNDLFKHFSASNRTKGICLIGSYGVGKTEIMKAFTSTRFHEFDYLKSGKNCHITSAIQMVEHYNSDKNFNIFFGNNLYIDDFGSEQRAAFMAKDEEPILSKFLELWYIKRENFNLYITTNMDASELQAKYGGRVYSRLSQLCEFKKISGKDFRI